MSFDKEIGLIQNLFSKVYEIQVVKDSIKEHRTSSETKVLNSPRGIKASKDLSKYDIIISSVENDETNDRITRRIKAGLNNIEIEKFDGVVGKIIGIKIKG